MRKCRTDERPRLVNFNVQVSKTQVRRDQVLELTIWWTYILHVKHVFTYYNTINTFCGVWGSYDSESPDTPISGSTRIFKSLQK